MIDVPTGSTRLFAAVVLMGCSLGGCVEERTLPGVVDCSVHDPDAGVPLDPACYVDHGDGGWPPTK